MNRDALGIILHGALVGLDKSTDFLALNFIGYRCLHDAFALISLAEGPPARIAALDGTAAAEPEAGGIRRDINYVEISSI